MLTVHSECDHSRKELKSDNYKALKINFPVRFEKKK